MAAYAIQFRRGTTTQHNSFTGLLGEVTVDTDKKTLVVHDGSTTGGYPLAREGAASNASTGNFTSNVLVGGTLTVSSTSEFNGDVSITGDLDITGDIIPTANITYDLGSPTMMWKDIYVGPGSLYVNGKKVIEDNNGSINFTTDMNETLKIVVPGDSGTLQFSAGSLQLNGEINAIAGDVTFGDHIDMNSNLLKNVANPVSSTDAANKGFVENAIATTVSGGTLAVEATTGDFSGDVTVAGSLTVTGSVTTVNSETIELADNILLLNSNAFGTATQSAGIEVERGDDLNVQFLWDETNNRWSAGPQDVAATNFIGDVTGDVTGTVSSLANHDTSDLAEGSNLYFTDARARSAISVSGDLTYNATTGVISTQGLASSDTDDLAEGAANLYFTDARAQSAVASDIATAKSEAIASAEAKDVVRAAAANAYADQAEADAVASAEAKDVVRAAAAAADATAKADQALVDAKAYADQAEADAVASAEAKDVTRAAAAAADATAKADQALVDAKAYADTAEADAVASAEAKDVARASTASDDRAAIRTEFAAADDLLDGRLDTLEGANTVVGSVAKAQADAIASAAADATSKADQALVDAKAYADTAEADAVASAEAKDAARATTASDDRAAIRSEFAAADVILQSNIDVEKGRINAILDASTSDADTFAEIVSLVNSVDTTNDSALGTEISNRAAADTTLQSNIDNEAAARVSADNLLDGRLDTVEGDETTDGSIAKALADAKAYADGQNTSVTGRLDTVEGDATTDGSIAKALADAKAYADTAEADAVAAAETKDVARATAANAYADQVLVDAKAYADTAEADAITSAATDATSKADQALVDAKAYADTAEADAVASAEAKDVARALTASNDRAAIRTEFAAADALLDGRLDTVEGDATTVGSIAKALADANAYADTAEADAVASAEAKDVTRAAAAAADATAKADQALVDAKAYADTAEADANTYADALNGDVTDRLDVIEGPDDQDGSIAKALADAKAYTDQEVSTVDNTDEMSEGTANLYFTDARARSAISVSGDLTYNSSTGVISTQGLASSSTDDLSEGTANLYFTDERAASAAKAAISASGDLSYDGATGAFSFTERTDAEVRGLVSAGGDLSYNSTTGAFSFTERTDGEVKALITGGTGVSVSNGVVSIGQSVATTSDVTFNDATINGNLTVTGTTTTVNSETIELADNIILLNSNATGSATQSGGIEIERGDDLNVQMIWDESADRWSFVSKNVYTGGTFVGDLSGDVTGAVTGTVSSLSNHSTDDLAEGSNLYFTTERAQDAVMQNVIQGTGIAVTYNDINGTIEIENTQDEIFVDGVAFADGDLVVSRSGAGDITVSLDGRYTKLGEDKHLVSHSFDTSTGVLSSGVLGESPVTVDLDGRYLLEDDERFVSGLSFNTTNGVLTATRENAASLTVDLDGRYLLASDFDSEDNHLTSLGFSASTGVLTATLADSSTVTVDLDGRYVDSVAAGAGLSNSGTSDEVTLDVNVDRGLSIAADKVGIANTGVTAGSYGGADSVATYTVNARGQMTAAGSTAISIQAAAVTDFSATARGLVSASGDLSYNSSTGAFSFTERTDAEVRGLISVSGDLSYNSSTGVLSATTYSSADFNTDFAAKSTSNLSEGSNKYFTDARAVAAVKAAMSMTHSGVYVVTAADETSNTGSSRAISAATLGFNVANKEMYQVYLNRQLLRPTEYSVNTSNGTLTFDPDLLAENDEIEAVVYG